MGKGSSKSEKSLMYNVRSDSGTLHDEGGELTPRSKYSDRPLLGKNIVV